MEQKTLKELAHHIRSKNAGTDFVTIDVIFDKADIYEKVKKSGVINKGMIAKLYNIKEDRIEYVGAFDPARAFKITIRRTLFNGNPGESDVFGAQQYAPLFDVKIPL